MSLVHLVLALVAAQRIGELAWAARNTARLRRRGAVEADRAGYSCLVGLHAIWITALYLLVTADVPIVWPLLAAYGALQPARLWVIATLGPHWTTRIIVVPGMPLVTRGPYRWLRHPNYLIVAAELALLPLAFGAVAVALGAAAANLVLSVRRIAIEDRALASAISSARRRSSG